jgi:hypothetical protein
MGLTNVDIESGMRRLADRRIEEAMREGKFDNLAGAGKELNLEDMPADENARMTWWCLRIMKQNEFTPHEIQYRKSIDHLKARLASAPAEADVCRLVSEINELIHKLNTLGTNAIQVDIAPLSVDAELASLRQRSLS